MFWFKGRSVEELSSAPNSDSATPTPNADSLCSGRSTNTDPAVAEDADSFTKTPESDTAFHDWQTNSNAVAARNTE